MNQKPQRARERNVGQWFPGDKQNWAKFFVAEKYVYTTYQNDDTRLGLDATRLEIYFDVNSRRMPGLSLSVSREVEGLDRPKSMHVLIER
jgi:hypothetical protein